MKESQHFMDKLKKIRQSKGLTQAELGKILGISQALVGQYESGRRHPKPQTIQRFAMALNVSINDLRDDNSIFLEELSEQMSCITDCLLVEAEQENILISNYRKLNATGKSEAQKRILELTEIQKYTDSSYVAD